jgi:hypothetical protein
MRPEIHEVIEGVRAGTVKKIDLSNYGMTVSDVCELVAAIAASPRSDLISMKISYDEVPGDEGIQAICTVLHRLYLVSLPASRLTDSSVAVIAKALETNTTVTGLGLMRNNRVMAGIGDYDGIGAEGAKRLAEMLRVNATLQKLVLDDCWIRSEGVQALAGALVTNGTLQVLTLESCTLLHDDVVALMKALESNSTLEKLVIDGTVAYDVAESVLAMLRSNTGLHTLHSFLDVPNADVLEAVRSNPRSVLSEFTSVRMDEATFAEFRERKARFAMLALDGAYVSGRVRPPTAASSFAVRDGDHALGHRVLRFLIG